MSDNTEKEQKLKQEDTQNEQIREMGQVVLDSNSRQHRVELLTISGLRRPIPKQRNTHMCCRNLQLLRMMKRLKVC